jgi:pyruvate formate lyase activating enzyme
VCRDCIRASPDKAIGFASARHGEARKAFDPPLVIASTLLVPGYVDAHEIGLIAGFIASPNPNIPYALLAFAPQIYMQDLPRTSVGHAEAAEEAARAAGLTSVCIGNRHLLSRDY